MIASGEEGRARDRRRSLSSSKAPFSLGRVCLSSNTGARQSITILHHPAPPLSPVTQPGQGVWYRGLRSLPTRYPDAGLRIRKQGETSGDASNKRRRRVILPGAGTWPTISNSAARRGRNNRRKNCRSQCVCRKKWGKGGSVLAILLAVVI